MEAAPWLARYDEGVPASLAPYPDKTLVDFLAEYANSTPFAPAFTFKGLRTSFRELDQLSDVFASGLRSLGVGKGDRVALILPNSPQFMIAEYAVWKLGAIIAPQNLLYTEHELEDSFRATQPSVAIVLSPYYERVKAIQATTTIRRVVATNIKEYLPPLLKILFTLVKEKKEGYRITLRDGDVSFASLMASPRATDLVKPAAGDPATLLMSGGTTGTPKAVLSAHKSLVISGIQIGAWLKAGTTGPRPSMMLPLPLFHTYGCCGAQTMTMTSGIPLGLVPNPRDINDVIKTIETEQPPLLCAVPTLLTALLQNRRVKNGKADFSSIQGIFSGASALMADTKRRFEELTGGNIVEGYSLTEATMALIGNPLRGAKKVGSVGVPFPDMSLKIVDPDDPAKVLPMHEVGEIVIKAPQLMEGYWNDPASTSEMLRDGWLYTGDLGYVDEDSYVFIVDRKKDVIKPSGFQVWPREVEEALAAHPAILDVGVAGVKDERKGEAVVAWVVLREGMTANVDELREWCKERLAPYKVPSRFEFRKELPKTLVGKVLRRVLAQEAAK